MNDRAGGPGEPGGPGRLRGWWRRHHEHHRSWPQRLVIAFNCCLILVLLLAAAGLGYTWSKYSRLPRIVVSGSLSESTGSSEPQNFLIVGVDTAASLDEGDPMREQREDAGIIGLRSDTIMVLRVDPGEERAQLLSLPRDLWVPLASGGHQRINAALQLGGPQELIDTIESYLSIPVHHYVQVDFAGFLGLVEAIDGVPIYFPYAARDRNSGLWVPEPGCVTLGPEEALAYARSRHYQYYEDGSWKTDGSGDLGRISRQQDFIRRALEQAIDQGLRNPVTLDRLIDVAIDSVTVDDLLTVEDLLDLARSLRSLEPSELEMMSVPVYDDVIGGAEVLRLRDEQARPILDRFRDPREPGEEPIVPAELRVQVLNGSGVGGQAAQVAAALERIGFGRAGMPDNNDRLGLPRTEVRYRPGREAAADLVARWLVSGADLVPVSEALGADVVVVTGTDFEGVRSSPAPSTSSTTPPTASTTAASPSTESDPATGSGEASSTTSSSTTTTSIVGEVPAAPDGVSC